MAIQKQNLPINFAMGLDTKTDPNQIDFGKFLELENSVFIKGKRLQTRNGFGSLADLDTSYKYLTTFNNNLTGIGTSLAAYSGASQSYVTKGTVAPLQIDTLPLIRTSANQTQADVAIASNGLVCTVYTDVGAATTYKYAIADSITGQNIVAPTTIATPSESPRVFLLGNYFVILFSQSATLKYIAVPINNTSAPIAAVSIVTNYAPGGTQLAFDGFVSNNNLYIAYNATDGGGAIRMTYLNSFLVRQTAATGVVVAAGKSATMMSVCADSTGPVIWVSFYLTAGTLGYSLAVDSQLNSILTATQTISAGTILNITSSAQSGACTIFYEVSTVYSYGASLPTNIINKRSIANGGSLTSASTIVRSVGLASKSFLLSGTAYMLSSYSSSYQPSYFLIDSSGNVISKLAYSNGGGYLTIGLPSVTVIDSIAKTSYLIKDLAVATNKSQSPASATPVYTQTGINLALFDFTTDGMNSSEIGSNLHLSGGLLLAYDGYQITEQGFNLYPDNVIVTTTTGAGNITAQDYYYQAIYEWCDNQGNIHRSAPSLPVKQTTTTASSTNTIKVPTLRLTYKTLVKIVLYRWSTAQQTYFQVTSVTSPTLNSITTDNVTITDTQADSAIVGNSILYTTGGVIEDIAPPPTKVMTLYRSRLFLVDGEDQNLLWYSKQVIESTPVEFSDLFTIYVAPTISAQGSTGVLAALSSMDDKLILFKKDAIYYLVGNGPDNTGANNDFSEPVFVTSTVGSENQNSIVFIPNGLMFESDKGIWLLGRDLSTTYIGAPVEDITDRASVLSAVTIPGTNQVRFNMSDGTTLMYDYFFNQWGTFSGASAISSTLFQGKHTYINSFGKVFQESDGSYLDGSRPVLLHLKSGWFNLAGLQGFQRAYAFYLLGNYVSPHKLNIQIAYDYNSSPTQTVIIQPDNFTPDYGDDPLYGSTDPYGGSGDVEKWRVNFETQKCEAFQITITEIFDPSLGTIAGAGLTLSGINLVVGMKSSYPRLRASNAVG